MTIEILLRLLGSLALLIYGMKTMSDALQKMAQLRYKTYIRKSQEDWTE